MEQFIIKGGKPLAGEVAISGAKNAALGILAAAVLTEETVRINNIPDIKDINTLLQAMENIGAAVVRIDNHSVTINAKNVRPSIVDSEAIRRMRGSYYLIGALLGRFKHAEVVLPGGCNIGNRPIDQHIKGFEALGAKVSIQYGKVYAHARELKGSNIYLDVASVGATINIMLAACLAKGMTVLENAAKEPHVVDVANFLNSIGANIKGAGTDIIRITGVERLHRSTYTVIPDQLEAGTFMVATVATKGDVVIKNIIPKHLEAITAKLVEMGAEVEEYDDSIRVIAKNRMKQTHIKTLPYPGFPTDMQAQIATLLAVSKGTSVVAETLFENRFKYVDELSRMGAAIKVENNIAIIEGVENLSGAVVCTPDLRAGAALIIAGLIADGYTVVEQIGYIERGYEGIERKLQELGAEIEKVEESDEKAIKKFKLRVG